MIGNNVWLGAGVTVLKGVTIGENTLVAAGSLATHSLPANVVAGGIPAKIIREINGLRLNSEQQD
jgi:maltose O-acetyltransferase